MWKYILNSIEKVKNQVLLSPWSWEYIFLNGMGQNPNLTAFTLKIQVFCRPEQTKATPWKWIFTIQMPKWVPLTVRAWKADEKIRHLSGFVTSPSWIMVLKLSKICCIWQFFADVRKKSEAATAIYVCVWKFLFHYFRKWYWLLCYDLEFRRC